MSLRFSQGWPTVVAALLGLLLYLLPFAVSSPGARLRLIWWGFPLLPAAMLLIAGIQDRHRYLNPLNPHRVMLAAERVLALGDGIVAGQHYDWVTAFARTLDEHGNPAEAVIYYRDALRLNPTRKMCESGLPRYRPR
ncbi:MAG: hypothetical protein ABI167_03480 [Nitrosospira sp.]